MRHLDNEQIGAVVRVVKVHGSGAFRQRLLEMGFVKGAEVTVLKNAPLRDPVEYMILGSHISLRHSEAAQVEVCDLAEEIGDNPYNGTTDTLVDEMDPLADNVLRVALVGNPNCGKTSLFNFVTGAKEKVGNYGGVTVDSKTGSFNIDGRNVELVDLPGTYSLTEYSPEEMYVRTFMRDNHPDAILNIVDAGNLERNLYLTTQIMDMNVPIVIALNMWDEFERSGDTLDIDALSRLLGATVIPITARNGKGVDKVLGAVMHAIDNSEHKTVHKNVNYGDSIEKALLSLEAMAPGLNRYTLLKVLENDSHAQQELHLGRTEEQAHAAIDRATQLRADIEREYNDDIVSVVSDLKYGFVRGALAEVLTPNPLSDKSKLGYALDVVLTNRWLGLPVLFLLMWFVFQTTFTVGAYPQEWIDQGVAWFGNWIATLMPEGTLRDLVVDGIIAGVGGVLVFLPNILILFFFISLLEDSGYMARAAFIVDRIMHRIGLHGKSFIPYLIGFGCSVPAIMGTRTLENRRDRIITILTVPFMSCSARLPVYLLLVSAFFATNQGVILMSLYLVGIAMAAFSAILLSKTLLKHDHTQFVMELPPYRMPTARNATLHMWSKGSQYLRKMGTVILAASIIVWALGYFPRHEGMTQQEQVENSFMGRMGKAIEPVVEPLGFNWQMGVSMLTGAAAKEIVVSTMGVLYTGEHADEDSSTLKAKLQTATDEQGNKQFTPIVAYSFMLFVLLYFPCIAALAAIRREAGTKWMIFEIIYTTGMAWLVSFIFYQSATFIQSL
ncbi:ferrous iron transport protein B [Sodaliphilus sp.]|uniref:ferrous iron transport protein B n=1 Tax=Sodaliphilus sp. TaxID=2815818 RepID=UPI00388F274A